MVSGIGKSKKTNLLFFIIMTVITLIMFGTLKSYADYHNIVTINEAKREYDLTNAIQILEDKDRVLSIEAIFDSEISKEFISYKDSKIKGRISNSAYWVTVVLVNETHDVQNMILEISKPHLGDIKLYRYNNQKVIKEIQTGRNYPFDKREVKHRNFLFEIKLMPEIQEKIILRIETESYFQLPIKLYNSKTFIEQEYNAQQILGIYYGIMIAMFLYNLVLFISLKDKAYLYYVLYLLGFSVVQLIWDGLAFQYLWPNSPEWEIKSNPIFLIFTAFFALQFSRSFLGVKEKSKLVDKIITYFSIILIFTWVLASFISPALSTKLSVYGVTISLILCITNIWVVGFNNKSVYLYSSAWVMLFLGVLLNLLAAYAILPINFITLYSPRIGSVFEVILLSLALVNRFNIIKQEKIIEKKQRVLLKKLNDITKILTSTHDLDILVRYTLINLSEITKYENGMFILKEQHQFIIKSALGDLEQELKDKTLDRLEEDEGFRKIIERKKAVILTDVEMSNYSVNKKAKTFTGIPIIYHEELLGLIILYSINPKKTHDIEHQIIYDFAGQVGISIQSLRLFNEIKKMATIDGLTGAFNRSYFTTLAESAFTEREKDNISLSLIMIDIDYFKQINDNYGHRVGDRVLQELVRSLREVVDSNCIIGRYGGEEFLVLQKNYNIEETHRIAEAMRTCVERLIVTIDQDISIKFTISLGVSTANKDVDNIGDLIERADKALYLSKQNGRNLVSIL